MNYKVKVIAEYVVLAADSDSAKHYIESLLPSPSENKAIVAMNTKVRILEKKGGDIKR